MTLFPLPVLPTSIEEWREFLVSYSWMTLVKAKGVTWRPFFWSWALTAVFSCKTQDNQRSQHCCATGSGGVC